MERTKRAGLVLGPPAEAEARRRARARDRWAGRRHAMPLSNGPRTAARPSESPVRAAPRGAPDAARVAAGPTRVSRARRAGLAKPHRAVIIVCAIALAVGMSFAVSNASRWGRTASSFVLEDVEVRGNHVLTDAEVTALSGLAMGTNLLTVRIGQVESAVGRSPRVQRVRASRALPGKVIVTLDEKLPIALVAVGSGRALEVAADGAVLPPVERSARVDLPLVTGIEAREGAPSPADLKQALELIVLAREASPSFAAEISEVRIAPGSGLVIYTVADGAEIRVGSGALDSRGMRRLSLVLSDLRSRGVRAESIDVRFRDQIVVRPSRDGASRRA